MTDKMKKKKKRKKKILHFQTAASQKALKTGVFCHNHKPTTTVIASRSPTVYYREDQELRNAK